MNRGRPPQHHYTCSPACQAVHQHCRGCGALAGPEHCHTLRDGYCYGLLGGQVRQAVPFHRSCWQVAQRTPAEAQVPEGAAHR